MEKLLRTSTYHHDVDQLLASGGKRRKVERLLREKLLRDAYLSPHKASEVQKDIEQILTNAEREFEKLGGETINTTSRMDANSVGKQPRSLSPLAIKKLSRVNSPTMNHKPVAPTKRHSPPRETSKSTPSLRGQSRQKTKKPSTSEGSRVKMSQTQHLLPIERPHTTSRVELNEMSQTWNGADVSSVQGKPSLDVGQIDANNPTGDMMRSGGVPNSCTASLVRAAAGVWDGLIDNLREAANAIQYRDLVELARMREPPAVILPIVGYVSVLLGLTPSWLSARRSLFKELVPLQKFLREVDPMSIPIRRVRKAYELKDNTMSGWDEESVMAFSHAGAKLIR